MWFGYAGDYYERFDRRLHRERRRAARLALLGVSTAANVSGEERDLLWLSSQRVRAAPDTSAGLHARAYTAQERGLPRCAATTAKGPSSYHCMKVWLTIVV